MARDQGVSRLHGHEMLRVRRITAGIILGCICLLAYSGTAVAGDKKPKGKGQTKCSLLICDVTAAVPGSPSTTGVGVNNPAGGVTGGSHSGGHQPAGPPAPPTPPLCTQNNSPAVCTPPCTGDGLVAGGLGTACTPATPGTPPSATPPPGPSPVVVAQQAVDRLPFPAPQIGIVPEPGPHKMGLVGLPIYMWTRDRTWGTDTATATAGTVVETASAKVTKVVWSMGNGEHVVCRSPGTVYEDRFAANPSPDCGYMYEKPGEYDVTATATYAVAWIGQDSGTATRVRTSTVHIRVGEMQAIIQ